MEHDGNGWVRCARGHEHWGRHGAAGLLLIADRGTDEATVLLQHRAAWTSSGDTWGVPGGAGDSHEDAVHAALRETWEETGIAPAAVHVFDTLVDDHGGWSYTTVMADLVSRVHLVTQEESLELRWVALTSVDALRLHPGFARTWPQLRVRVLPPVQSGLDGSPLS
ncbi:MAG TPA: NUDIX domain-containing protein [Propionibacteriaceae bacterium]